MLQTEDNPGGVPIEVFDGIRAGSIADRSQQYQALADGPFFGANRPGAIVSKGTRDAFWRQGMQSGHRNALECIAAFSATDFRGDIEKFDVPTLVIHGDDDQVVPFSVGGQASAAMIDGATLKVYPGAPHGITDTHKEQLGHDLLTFTPRSPLSRVAVPHEETRRGLEDLDGLLELGILALELTDLPRRRRGGALGIASVDSA